MTFVWVIVLPPFSTSITRCGCLDELLAGIDAYYVLTDHPDPTPAALVRAWYCIRLPPFFRMRYDIAVSWPSVLKQLATA